MYVDQSTIPYLDGFWFLDGMSPLPSKHVAGPSYDNRNSFTPHNLVFGRPENRSFYDNFSESFSRELPFGPCDFVFAGTTDVAIPLRCGIAAAVPFLRFALGVILFRLLGSCLDERAFVVVMFSNLSFQSVALPCFQILTCMNY